MEGDLLFGQTISFPWKKLGHCPNGSMELSGRRYGQEWMKFVQVFNVEEIVIILEGMGGRDRSRVGSKNWQIPRMVFQ